MQYEAAATQWNLASISDFDGELMVHDDAGLRVSLRPTTYDKYVSIILT